MCTFQSAPGMQPLPGHSCSQGVFQLPCHLLFFMSKSKNETSTIVVGFVELMFKASEIKIIYPDDDF